MENVKLTDMINKVYVNLQNLSFQPTEGNVALSYNSMALLKAINERVVGMENDLAELEHLRQENKELREMLEDGEQTEMDLQDAEPADE